ncbi:homocysteine S-methyltransferase family protein [Luteibaculum oceani]|uniref:Methionine synthase n=1 Tax=Luteibaculum oceani TaxID=1294296 RepID=A0A5C6UQZ5_9FLAO|nr:homocysteine S-methyltransferase family protein [Luteibaculum oceani]TXC75637.1 5-methyltetrahydrofolate--homocysteine methyltransferase [Luteibaculum oceani]
MKVTEAIKQRILVLDGAMGTMIQRYKLEEEDFRTPELKHHEKSLKGNNDLIGLSRPEILAAIHEEYLAAGADILETNTFSGTTIAQEDYSCEHLVDEINIKSAQIAKAAADKYTALTPDKPRYVAGSMGPTNKTASISPNVNDPGYRAIDFDTLAEAYRQQAVGLMKGGVDLLLVETVFDTLNAKAALFGIEEAFTEMGSEIPVMVSGTITDASGRTLSGQTAEAFLISISHFPLFSVGLNCALGASQLRQYIQVLAKNAPFYISAHPNAGLPNEFGAYDETPEFMAKQIKEFLDLGLINIIGGCCGTTPDHIQAIAELAAKYEPRKMASPALSTVL